VFVPAWKPSVRQLCTLTDQGAPRRLELSDFGVGGRDRSWNAHAENFIAANRPQLSAIGVEPQLVAGRGNIHLVLRPGGVVGAVPLHAPDTRKVSGGVVVRPRFGWDGIGALLDQVGWAAQPQILEMPLVPGSAREVPPWVLAGPVLTRLTNLLKELRRGFRMEEAVRQTPRGQILWQSYVNSQAIRGAFHRIPCRFPDLGPDVLLRSYLRWGIETVQRSLAPFSVVDTIARRLSDRAHELLVDLKDTPARTPDAHSLRLLMGETSLPTEILIRGLQALGWVLDERGLAGHSETDGLAWALPMYVLFERWVEHILRGWAREFGGEVHAGRVNETSVPFQWSRPGHGSLTTLIPDFLVRRERQLFVVDAKYKGHFEELDETRWHAVAQEMHEEHRHDVHQILAYAALFDADEITSVLVYPMHASTWRRLAAIGQTIKYARISSGQRRLGLALVGIPLSVAEESPTHSVTRSLDVLRTM